MDFSEIVLPEVDLCYLKIAGHDPNGILSLEQKDAQLLEKLEFLERNLKYGSENHFSVTQLGILYLNYLEEQKKREQQEKEKWRSDNHREWIGIKLSGFTAVASLIVAAISLVWQMLR